MEKDMSQLGESSIFPLGTEVMEKASSVGFQVSNSGLGKVLNHDSTAVNGWGQDPKYVLNPTPQTLNPNLS